MQAPDDLYKVVFGVSFKPSYIQCTTVTISKRNQSLPI